MVDVNIIVPTRTGGVFTQQASRIGFVDSHLQGFALANELAAHINIASVRAHGETGQQATFQQLVRLIAHNIAVFAGAWL